MAAPALKKLGRSDATRRVLGWVIQLYIRLIWRTNRWSFEGFEVADEIHAAKQPYVAAFWHGRLLMMPYGWPRVMPLHMLSSPHADSRIMAEAVRYFGIDIIPGSSNRGGLEALRAMVKALRAGNCVAITPDGPDGPAMSVSPGIVAVARMAKAPIALITYATSRRRILKVWDDFHLPLPFGRGIFLVGPLLEVPPQLSEEAAEDIRRRVESVLRALTAEADRRMGHEALAPGTMSRDAFRALRRAAARG
jgi:lysophospholipid acyltransferase (LPLAT)-like uncharacterized protein